MADICSAVDSYLTFDRQYLIVGSRIFFTDPSDNVLVFIEPGSDGRPEIVFAENGEEGHREGLIGAFRDQAEKIIDAA